MPLSSTQLNYIYSIFLSSAWPSSTMIMAYMGYRGYVEKQLTERERNRLVYAQKREENKP